VSGEDWGLNEMDVLNPDWSDWTDSKGCEVRTTLVGTARVGQPMTSVVGLGAHRAPVGGIGGVRPANSRGGRRPREPRPAERTAAE
jgi:hypothetical protein